MRPGDAVERTYAILSSDRMALGLRVRHNRAQELVSRYSPTSIMPEDWPEWLGLSIVVGYCTHVACEEMRG